MNDYHDRQDEPHQGEDRPVAGWPGHNPDEHTGEHTEERAGESTDAQTEDPGDETREEEEPLVGEVWNDDATGEREPGWSGERNGPSDVSAGESAGEAEETEGAEETKRDHVAEPFGTEEPMTATEAADDESDGVTAEPAASAPGAVEDPPETAGPAGEPAVEPVAVAEPVAAEPGSETEAAAAEAAGTTARPAAAAPAGAAHARPASAPPHVRRPCGRDHERSGGSAAKFIATPAVGRGSARHLLPRPDQEYAARRVVGHEPGHRAEAVGPRQAVGTVAYADQQVGAARRRGGRGRGGAARPRPPRRAAGPGRRRGGRRGGRRRREAGGGRAGGGPGR